MTTPEDPGSQEPPPYSAYPPPSGMPQAGSPQFPSPQYNPPQYGAPPPYGAPPQWGQQYGGGPPYQQNRGTNGMAIASFIVAFLCSPLGLVFGLVAKSQIKNSGQGGDGLATAGIVLSVVFFILGIILVATGHAAFHFSTGSSG